MSAVPGGDTRPTAALTCGPAGAGKTTWATARVAQGWARLSTDEEVWARGHTDHQAPQPVLDAIDVELRERLTRLLREGRDVVVDLSFCVRSLRAEYRDLARAAGARVVLVHFDVPLPELRRRLAHRDLEPGPNAARLTDEELTRYAEGFEHPVDDEGFDALVEAAGLVPRPPAP